jgi:hypothetical protein
MMQAEHQRHICSDDLLQMINLLMINLLMPPRSVDRLAHPKTILRRALLRRMAPEHKFATAARLCSEVLAPFAEGAVPLGGAAEVLRDGLRILASRDMRARRHRDTDITTCSSLVAAPEALCTAPRPAAGG